MAHIKRIDLTRDVAAHEDALPLHRIVQDLHAPFLRPQQEFDHVKPAIVLTAALDQGKCRLPAYKGKSADGVGGFHPQE